MAPTTEVIRLTRASVSEVMTKNYIKVAQTKGLSTFEIVRRHAMKNALPPIIPKLGMQFAAMMTFAMLTESIFNGRELVAGYLMPLPIITMSPFKLVRSPWVALSY